MASPKKKSSPAAKAAKHAKKAIAHAKEAEKHANASKMHAHASKKHAKLANKAVNDAKNVPFPAKITTKNNNAVYAPRVGGMGLFSHQGVVPAVYPRSTSPNLTYGYRSTGGKGLFSAAGPVPVFPKKKRKKSRKSRN